MRGRLFKLGEHRLLWGDSSDHENMAALIGDLPVSLVVTDPPYGVNMRAVPGKKTDRSISHDNVHAYKLGKMIFNSFSYIRERNPMCLWYFFAGGEMLRFGFEMLDDLFLTLRCKLEWVKDNFVITRGDYHYQTESILFAGSSDTAHKNKARNCSNVIFWKAAKSCDGRHPAEKPQQILEQFILNSSKPGEYVADPFGGSGSTMRACERTGRKCLMAEIDERWVYVTMHRWLADTDGKLPIFEITDGSEVPFAVPDKEEGR